MENRAKVVCHMMTTIDGKISIDWDGNEDYEFAGAEYDRLIYAYGQAMGCGRATCQMDIPVDFSKYKDVPVKYEDKIVELEPGVSISVAFDRFGKLRWGGNASEYAGHRQIMMEVLTEMFSSTKNKDTLFGDTVIQAIAEAHCKTPAQVILRWHLQIGNVAIPGSKNEAHIREDFEIFDFELSDKEMEQMGALNRDERFSNY